MLKIFLYISLLTNLYSTRPAGNDAKITVIGTALNAKAGAVVQTVNAGVYYLDGLNAWSKIYYGKKVKVTGQLVVEKHEPQSTDSMEVQELVGTVRIIKKPKWVLAE